MGGLDLKSYTFPELETAVAELGLPRFRAGQIWWCSMIFHARAWKY